jgi:kynurenine formamidase
VQSGHDGAMKTLLSGCLALSGFIASLAGAEPPFTGGRWIDLTHDFSTNTLYWPTAKPFTLEVEFHAHTDKGYFYAANRYSASEHGGTHIDAPIHFAEGRKTLDQLDIDQLTGPAVVVDVSPKAQTNADYQISVADLKAWEAKHGRIPEHVILLFNTGYARHWPDARKYLGTEERGPGAIAKLHFPGLHPDAARWLVKERTIKAVGLDTASIDYGQSTLFESHCILLEKNIPAFENVAALDQLPATGAYVVALPMKIKDGSGGPLRIVAWVGKKP